MNKIHELKVKPVEWVGNTKRVVQAFPKPVKQTVGQALFAAQAGDKHHDAKPMRGFKGAGVVEIVEDHDGDTYRAVYPVRLKGVVYALHAFQKKSKKGIKTPKAELDTIKQRLKAAEKHYEEHHEGGRK